MSIEKVTRRWHVIDRDLGAFPEGKESYKEYDIPPSVGDGANRARQILVYAWAGTGSGFDPARHMEFKIFVEDREKFGEAGFYLRTYCNYKSTVWTYNSENFWLPMPEDSKLKVQHVNFKQIEGKFHSNLKITYATYDDGNR